MGCSGMADKEEGVDGDSTGRDRDEREEETESVPYSGEGGSKDAADGPRWSNESRPSPLRDRRERLTDPVSHSAEATKVFAIGLWDEA
jgi:hypothetical protein